MKSKKLLLLLGGLVALIAIGTAIWVIVVGIPPRDQSASVLRAMPTSPTGIALNDLCSNIAGVQAVVPAGYTLVNGQCVRLTNMCTESIYVMGGHDNTSMYNDAWAFNGTTWNQLPTTPWQKREYASTVFYKDKLWLMGGIDASGGYLNDVWSYDGVAWHQEANAGWSGRARMGAAVYNGKIWVMGGRYNQAGASTHDVWSFDGVTWTHETDAPWSARNGFTATTLGNNLVVIAGITPVGSMLRDIWMFNGSTWTQGPVNNWFSQRFEFGSAVMNNKIWVAGGGASYLTDTWSFDGTNLVQINPGVDAPWSETVTPPNGPAYKLGRGEFKLNTFGNKIYLMGGSYTYHGTEKFFNDVWTFDGANWTQQPNAPWAARDGYSSAVGCVGGLIKPTRIKDTPSVNISR